MSKCPNCDEPIVGDEPLCPHCDYQLGGDAEGQPLPGYELAGLPSDTKRSPNYRCRLVVLRVGAMLCLPGIVVGGFLVAVGLVTAGLVWTAVGLQLSLWCVLMYCLTATCADYIEEKLDRTL